MTTNEARSTKYDAFLYLVGSDIHYTFAGNLYDALRRHRISTFFTQDNQPLLQSSDQIPPSALTAINESDTVIVVFSEKYASFPKCLDEFELIFRYLDMNNRLYQLVPVFYKVKPWEIREYALRSSAYDTTSQLKCFSCFIKKPEEKMGKQLKAALLGVIHRTGFVYKGIDDDEYGFIQRIVQTAKRRLRRYDVFLSFSGEDTRYSFTGFLYHAFRQEGFHVFMDDEGLVGGNQIPEKLMEAIENSRLSVVVFSENYGYSTWCLDELAKIIECMKTKNQMVWPIFYNVEKSDVCNQTKSYGDAMTAHHKRFGNDSKKVHKWKSALSDIANLEGEQLAENEYQYKVIQRIVEKAIDIEDEKHIII